LTTLFPRRYAFVHFTIDPNKWFELTSEKWSFAESKTYHEQGKSKNLKQKEHFEALEKINNVILILEYP
jgi:hypothetical protein